MGSDFEFSTLIMGLIILVTLIRIFTSKPKVTPMKEEGTHGDDLEESEAGERRVQTLEDLLGQFVEKQSPKPLSQPQPQPQPQVVTAVRGADNKREAAREKREASRRVVAQASKRSSGFAYGSDLSGGEIGDEIGSYSGEGIGDGSHQDDGVVRGRGEYNFDLREAVIMSEILTRKYDE